MNPLQVLFICFGNACRSQMAEGFARAYGSDVMEARSAGLSPHSEVPEGTLRAMQAKGVDISGQFPKGLEKIGRHQMDLVINMSGYPIPGLPRDKVRVWTVDDPMGQGPKAFRRASDEIETMVMNLVLELRRAQKKEKGR